MSGAAGDAQGRTSEEEPSEWKHGERERRRGAKGAVRRVGERGRIAGKGSVVDREAVRGHGRGRLAGPQLGPGAALLANITSRPRLKVGLRK